MRLLLILPAGETRLSNHGLVNLVFSAKYALSYLKAPHCARSIQPLSVSIAIPQDLLNLFIREVLRLWFEVE